ncbi:MAG: hypothetical protein WCL28_13945, partial [bacterium]
NLSLVVIILFGPDSFRNFALAMTVGILGATLTTNFVGSSYLLWVDRLLSKKKAGMARVEGRSVAHQGS